MYDDWVNQMIKDMGIKQEEEGEKKNEVTLSDTDIKKVADSVIERLSSDEEVSTPKPPKKKEQEQEQEQEQDDDSETPIE